VYNLGRAISLRNTGAPTGGHPGRPEAQDGTDIRTDTGGTFTLTGVGLAWAEAVYVGKGTDADVNDPTKFVVCQIQNPGQSDTELVVKVPGPLPLALQSETKLDIVVGLANGPATVKSAAEKQVVRSSVCRARLTS